MHGLKNVQSGMLQGKGGEGPGSRQGMTQMKQDWYIQQSIVK